MDAPVPTLRALLARPDLHLTLASAAGNLDEGALDAGIRWVHSTDLADPTPFLTEDVVLLTTGTQFLDDTGADAVAYVARLRGRGVLALGFGTEVVRAGIPAALVDACRRARMPLFEVPYRTPFIAIARANADAVAAQAYARRSWALAAQRAISLAALRPDGLEVTLAELARQLDAWVGLFDAAGSLAREHPAGGLAPGILDRLNGDVGAVLRRGARAGSSLRIDDVPFTLQTLGRGGSLRGVIAIAAGDLDQEGRGLVTAVVAMAGLALEQRQGWDRARALLRTGVWDSLLTGDPALARRISRDLWGGLPAEPLLVAVADAASAHSHAAAEWLEVRSENRGVFFAVGDEGIVLVANVGAGAVIDEFAEATGARVGVSDPTGYAALGAAHERAVRARDFSGARAEEGGSVTHFGELAAGDLVIVLSEGPGRAIAEAAIAPLVAHDGAHGTALVATLRAWLDADASHEAAARALGVHRHTVRARVAHAERILGHELASFSARARLWTALQIGGGAHGAGEATG